MRLAFARSALASPARMAASVASRARRRTTGASSSVVRSLATTRSTARLASRTSRSVSASSSHVFAASRRAAGEATGALERVGDRVRRPVLVVAFVFDGRPRHVAQAQLLLAQRAPDGGELADADGGRDDGAQRAALAVLDAPREIDLALAREERHARELLEVRGDCVGRGAVADGMDGKGGGHCALKGEYGPTARLGLR